MIRDILNYTRRRVRRTIRTLTVRAKDYIRVRRHAWRVARGLAQPSVRVEVHSSRHREERHDG